MPASNTCRLLQIEEPSPPDENLYPNEWRRHRKPHVRLDLAGYASSAPETIRYIHVAFEKHVALLERLKPNSDADEAKFQRLVAEWKNGTAIYSSMGEVAMHPAYQQMIGMGSNALPFIFDRLISEGSEPDHWFWALAAITTENPVPKESRGRVTEMAKAWRAWGEENGYIKLA